MLTMSSSSSSSIYPWKYDIFLSFRGKETRKSFVHHLYVALNRNGINTFRDDNNIRRGEDIALELLETIGESWGSIIVFSEGYAFSSWCLDELVEIVKQRNERGHQVYPIFYNVEVSDLKYQRGRVHEAFGMHEERCKDNKKKMQRWRDALSQVADISGWLLKDQYESIFIEDIVKKISTKLSQTYSQLKHLNSKFNIGQDDVRTIGVCGTSGTSKTIFARDEHLLQSFRVDDLHTLTTLDARTTGLAAMDFSLSKMDELGDIPTNFVEEMNDFKRKLEGLNALKENIESRMGRDLELHPRKKPKKVVELWLRNVETINGEIQDLEQKFDEGSVVSRGFLIANVFKKMQEAEELLQQGQFHSSLVDDNRGCGRQALPTTALLAEEETSCNSSSAEEDLTEHGEIRHVKSEGEIIPPNSEPSLEIGEKQINQHGDSSCNSSSPCIFRTPYPELDFQEPQLVSIGPYHRGKSLPLENNKYFFLEKFISRTRNQGKDLRFYVQDMMTLERRTRRCYSEDLSMSSIDFVEMMLVDACFILEVLRHFGRSEESEDGFFPIEPWKIPILVQDLLVLENQIPFFVLEKLFDSSESKEGTATFSINTMALKFISLAFPGSMGFSCKSNHLEANHLLDLFLESIRPSSRSTVSNSLHLKTMVIPKSVHSFLMKINPRNQAGVSKIGQDILLETPATIPKLKESEPSIPMGVKLEQQCDPPPPVHLMKSAMELQSSGIEFRPRRANRFTDINFKDGVLEIPPVTINELFLAILINCMAFEHRSEQRSKDLIAYVSFMSSLITHSNDAELLSSNGIISRFSYDDKIVAASFHSLGVITLNLDIQDSYLCKTLKETECYYTIWEGKTWCWWRCFRRYYGIALFCITNFMFAFNRLTSGLNLMLYFVKEVKFVGHSSLDLGLSEFLVFCFLNLIIIIMILMGSKHGSNFDDDCEIPALSALTDVEHSLNVSEKSVDHSTGVSRSYETAMDDKKGSRVDHDGKDIEPDQDKCHEDLEANRGLAAMDFSLSEINELCDTPINLDERVNDLNRKLQRLKAHTKSRMSAEQQHPRKKLKEEIQLWLKDVERINEEIQDLQQNYFKKIREVDELLQRGKFQDSLVVDDLGWIEQALSTTTLVGDAAKICMEEIWAYLMDDSVSKIGVWGMGGVGKTTLMKLVNNQLLKETEKFNIVIWITVSKEMNIFKLQNSIAKAMKVSLLEVEDEASRAGFINEMLSQKGKYVLILDDLWDKLSLEDVGIPEPSNGSKLLVTSRLLDVCHFLGCREVRMPTLSKPDAWSLFSQKVGQDVLNDPHLLPIVESVAEECAGLPLAIVTIASSMKGVRDIHEWRNALHELKRHVESVNSVEGKVFQRLQFSYDRLHNEKLRHCFLCCALYPEDWEIQTHELIKLWVAEGLVEEMDSMQKEVDKGHAILNKLKNSCLIENGTRHPDRAVKLHDIVRDMALRITSARPRFLVRAGLQLKEIPNVREWNEDLEKVSLMLNWGLQIPSQMPPPRCQKLTTLLLSHCDIKSIPECFFDQMHGLKILDLSWNPIKSLPNSISNVETLTTLLLGYCEDLRKVPSFSKLQALKKLVLRETNIKDLPHGLERLVNLKYLDLANTRITKVAHGLLANFTSLQHLAIVNDEETVERFVRAEEIGGLRKLEFFEGGFYDLNELNNYIKALDAPAEGPRRYYISVGLRPHFYFPSEPKKVIELSCNICTDGIKVLSDVEGLGIWKCIVDLCEEEAFSSLFILPPHNVFSSLSDIRIDSCQNIKKLFWSSWVLQNLQNLKSLWVQDCEDMEDIIAPESESEEEGISAINFALPILRILVLSWLPKLKSICSANGVMVFDSIEEIYINNCPQLKRIPLSLPLRDDGQPSPSPSLNGIFVPKQLWELVELDQPNAKSLLEPYVKYLK